MKKIITEDGYEILVDNQDADVLSETRISVCNYRGVKQPCITLVDAFPLARMITGASYVDEITFLNGNPFDLQHTNLAIKTGDHPKHLPKGVVKRGDKFVGVVYHKGKKFETEPLSKKDAASERDTLVLQLFGGGQ